MKSIRVEKMQKIKVSVRVLLVFLCRQVTYIIRSIPIFKRFANILIRYFPRLALIYMRMMSRPSPAKKKCVLTPNATAIFNDLKAAKSQLQAAAHFESPSKGV